MNEIEELFNEFPNLLKKSKNLGSVLNQLDEKPSEIKYISLAEFREMIDCKSDDDIPLSIV